MQASIYSCTQTHNQIHNWCQFSHTSISPDSCLISVSFWSRTPRIPSMAFVRSVTPIRDCAILMLMSFFLLSCKRNYYLCVEYFKETGVCVIWFNPICTITIHRKLNMNLHFTSITDTETALHHYHYLNQCYLTVREQNSVKFQFSINKMHRHHWWWW